jgi:hypothetical protein
MAFAHETLSHVGPEYSLTYRSPIRDAVVVYDFLDERRERRGELTPEAGRGLNG